MNRNWLRLAELVCLTVLALGLLILAAYMVYLDRMGEAFGTVLKIAHAVAADRILSKADKVRLRLPPHLHGGLSLRLFFGFFLLLLKRFPILLERTEALFDRAPGIDSGCFQMRCGQRNGRG